MATFHWDGGGLDGMRCPQPYSRPPGRLAWPAIPPTPDGHRGTRSPPAHRGHGWRYVPQRRHLTQASGYPSAPRFADEQVEAQPLWHCGEDTQTERWVCSGSGAHTEVVREAGAVREAAVRISRCSAAEREARWSRTGGLTERCSRNTLCRTHGGSSEGKGRKSKEFKEF